MVAVILGLFAFFSLTPAAHGQSSINLSRDLVNLGIAAQNMTPNQPNLDARPLFQAALQYAQAHSTTAITVDTGAYYFLTPQYFDRYLVFSGLSNITIDLNGSDIYFNQSFLMGFDIESAQNLVLENFTVDFLQLPFTQVQVSSVDPVGRVIQVNTLPGWQTPSEFNAIRNPYGQA